MHTACSLSKPTENASDTILHISVDTKGLNQQRMTQAITNRTTA